MKLNTAFALISCALFMLFFAIFLRSTFAGPGEVEEEMPMPPMKGRGGEGKHGYLFKPEIPYQVWFARGKSFLRRREYEQAILAFRKALREKPLSAEGHFLLGAAYEARGKEGLPGDVTSWDTLAEYEYRSSVALGDYLPARYNLGLLMTRQSRLDEARKEWEHILTISPKSSLGNLARRAMERNVEADMLPDLLEIKLPKARD